MSYASEVLADSPVVYFRLGDASGTTMTDASGNARNGTYVNTPALAQAGGIVGDYDGAVKFTRASSQKATFPTTGLPSGSSSYSLEAWIYPFSIDNNQGIISLGNNGTNGQANTLRLDTASGGSIVNYWWANDLSVAAPQLKTNTWSHVVVTWDGTTHSAYYNGFLIGSRTPSAPNVVLTNVNVGFGGTGTEYFDGLIDEAAVYTSALSAARVKAHYLAGAPLYARVVLRDSPLVYYRLDETSGTTMTDSSGNARNGTYYNSPTLGVGSLVQSEGAGGKAVLLNGSNQLGATTYAAWMDTTPLTLECIVRTTAASLGGLIERDSDSGPRVYQWRVETNGTVLWLPNPGAASAVYSTTACNDGKPHHLVATYDGTNSKIYVDGVLEGTTAYSATLSTGGQDLCIGRRNNDSYLNGVIDEAAIYSVALTAAQVQAHYRAFFAPYADAVLQDKPSLYLRFDEASGSTAQDYSGNSKNQTKSGTYTAGQASLVQSQPGGAAVLWSVGNINLANHGLPLSTSNATWTMEMWFTMPTGTFSSNNDQMLFGVQIGGGTSLDVLFTTGGGGALCFNTGNGDYYGFSVSAADKGTNCHLVAVFTQGSAASVQKLYLNGKLQTTSQISGSTGSLASTFSAMVLAAWNSSSGQGISGITMDEVACYPTALSAARVQAHYDAGIQSGFRAKVPPSRRRATVQRASF